MIKILFVCLSVFVVASTQLVEISDNCMSKIRKDVIDAHNSYRYKHRSSKIFENQALHETAQTYADQMANTDTFAHSTNRVNTGENLFYEQSENEVTDIVCSKIGKECVDYWYEEISMYDFQNPSFSADTGHFTQLLWNGSKKIGVGFAVKKEGNIYKYYCVAHYQPPGNVIGYFADNVKKSIASA